jgi:VWFA-related protein
MFPRFFPLIKAQVPDGRARLTTVVLLAFCLMFVLAGGPLRAQSQPASSSSTSSSGQQNQQPNAQQQEPPPEAGGPQGDIGPMAVPKKKEAPPEAAPPKVKNPPGMPDYSLHVDVPLVNVDVLVTTKNGEFIPGLKGENFRVLEDGVPQKITSFAQSEAPVTAVMLVEFASTSWPFLSDMLTHAYGFAGSLKQQDWAALISFDIKPRIEQDFTQNKSLILGALNRMRIPGFAETAVFDALYDTMDRMDRIPGRKYIILIASGYNSFSRRTYDEVLKKVKNTRNVTIFAISTGQAFREYLDSRGALGSISRLDFLQADNQMNTFAHMTGGKAYFPMFSGQMPEIVGDVSNSIRNQYTLAYHSTNPKEDGTYRKLKVELVDDKGGPLRMNVNGKPAKYNIIAREGYTAKHQVE